MDNYEKTLECNRKRYQKRKAEGKCTMCGAQLPTDISINLCEKCNRKQKSASKKFREKQAREHLCNRCSVPLPTNYKYKNCFNCRLKYGEYRERKKCNA